MKHYAIYDLETGRILQTHAFENGEGESVDVPDEDILATLPPDIARDSVGVTSFERTRETGSSFRVDVTTRKVVQRSGDNRT